MHIHRIRKNIAQLCHVWNCQTYYIIADPILSVRTNPAAQMRTNENDVLFNIIHRQLCESPRTYTFRSDNYHSPFRLTHKLVLANFHRKSVWHLIPDDMIITNTTTNKTPHQRLMLPQLLQLLCPSVNTHVFQSEAYVQNIYVPPVSATVTWLSFPTLITYYNITYICVMHKYVASCGQAYPNSIRSG